MYKQETFNQHYVSWFYLKNWISESSKHQKGIWASRDGGVPFFAQGRNKIAQIDRFYRVQVDQVVLDMMRYKYPLEHSANFVQQLLQQLPVMASVTQYIARQAPLHARLENINTNFLENKYAELEGRISRDLSKLHKGRWRQILATSSATISLYESLLCMYALQLFRTPSMRDQISKEITSFTLTRDGAETVLSTEQKDTLIKLIIYVESMRLFEQLRQARPLIDIYESQSRAGFQTSDAPAQLSAYKVDSQKNYVEYLGVMPLSPALFMVIRKDAQTKAKIMLHSASLSEVKRINQTFVQNNKGREVYATKRESLIRFAQRGE